FAEHLASYVYQTSGMGQVPLVGRFFRKQGAMIERSETIVLLTPHVVRAPALPPETSSQHARPKSPKANRSKVETVAGSSAQNRRKRARAKSSEPPSREKVAAAAAVSHNSPRVEPMHKSPAESGTASQKAKPDSEGAEPYIAPGRLTPNEMEAR